MSTILNGKRFAAPTACLLLGIGASVLLAASPTVRARPAPVVEGRGLRVIDTVRPGFDVVWQKMHDVDGDGRADLLAVGRGGEVRSWHFDPQEGKFGERPRGDLAIPAPDRSLIALGNLLEVEGPPQLVVASPEGVTAYPVSPDGAIASKGVVATRAARFALRVGHPRAADILSDVDGDGRLDVILPTFETCELWMNGGSPGKEGGADEGGAAIAFHRTATIPVDVDRDRSLDMEAISNELTSTLVIPRLRIRDINADGRSDLIVSDRDRRLFHLQTADGVLPRTPDVVLDLDIFRDTTPKAEVRLGRTFAGSDDAQFQMSDLNGDGIPDYLIHHRRKVWVFHGTKLGPQFTHPSSILKVSEDISTLLVVDLDDDPFPDLLLLRLELPTIATLMKGLFTDWDVEITAIGFAGTGKKSFEETPRWTSELVLRLPSILGIVRNPEELVSRFEEAARTFRVSLEGDFDGSGGSDVALVSMDETSLELWLGEGSENFGEMEKRLGRLLRKMLFEDKDRVWDLERILSVMSGLGEKYTALLTGDRDPDARTLLRADESFVRRELLEGDIVGDGRSEILITYREKASGAVLYDVLKIE
jgi:hypothetical protein